MAREMEYDSAVRNSFSAEYDMASGRVQSLSRGLKLLSTIIRAEKEVSNAELDDVLPIERSSTFRLLQTLVDEGFLKQDKQTKRFSSGPKILELAKHVVQSTQIARVCHPYLDELTGLTGETSHCAVLSGGEAFVIDHVLSPQTVGVTGRAPRLEPVYCTALGKALLVSCDDNYLRKLFAGIKPKAFTPNTILSLEGFLEEIHRVRREGVGVDNEEFSAGVRCVAAPVMDFSEKCVGAIGVSGPIMRLDSNAMRDVRRHVMSVAEKLSRELGYVP